MHDIFQLAIDQPLNGDVADIVTFCNLPVIESGVLTRFPLHDDAVFGTNFALSAQQGPTPRALLAERYDAIEQVRPSFTAKRYYVFEGGCVYWTFAFDAGVSATESVAIGDSLGLVPRSELQRMIRESFLDEEI